MWRLVNATEFMAGFSSAGRTTAVTLSTVSVASSHDLNAKLEHLEGFAARSGCRMSSHEIELCGAIRSELATRSTQLNFQQQAKE